MSIFFLSKNHQINIAMDVTDILYTPLDLPPFPKFSTDELREWIVSCHSKQTVHNNLDASKHLGFMYPWNVTYAKQDGKWLNEFNSQFPALSKFFHEAYGFEDADLDTVCILPLRQDFTGTGFWHSDQDPLGLRMYLENENVEGASLLIKPLSKKYKTRDELGILPRFGSSEKVQNDVVYEVKSPVGASSHFLNNMSCVHAVKSNDVNLRRIAVVVGIKRQYNTDSRINELILRSAEKFKDSAIFWTEPK